MKFGLLILLTDYTISPVMLAQLAEAQGFESIFLPEHTHVPADRTTPFPDGGTMNNAYWHLLDPFVALGAMAAATTTVKLATGICLVAQRDPIVTAKAVATLDHVSGGRFLFGVGAGWNREEMRNHGVDPTERMAIMIDRVEAMKCIWANDEATYESQYTRFERIWCWPKPAQKPHPPIIIGGNGPTVVDRVLTVGGNWMPIAGRADDALPGRIKDLRERAADRGLPRPEVSLFRSPTDPQAVERLTEQGVDRFIFALRPGEPAEVEQQIQGLADVRRHWAS